MRITRRLEFDAGHRIPDHASQCRHLHGHRYALEITLSGEEFIRRFLMHVPPKRFVRIRHYGLLSSRNKKKKITLCRNILGCKKYISKLKDMDAPAIIRLLYNKDICKCSSCGGKIIPLPTEQHFIKPKPHMLC